MPQETMRYSGSPLPIGYEFGGYRIEKVLGQGGNGITYLAYEQALNRRSAIKELFPRRYVVRSGQDQVVARNPADKVKFDRAKIYFLEEARRLGRFHNAHIVRVQNLLENLNGTAYFVMDYVDAQNVEQWLHSLRSVPNETQLRSVLLPMLDGLEYIHAHGVFHQDISPENILITPEGRPVLIDFGSAEDHNEGTTKKTSTGQRVGYSAYELYYGGEKGPYTDLYALSGVMIRAITGKVPPAALDRRTNPAVFQPMLQRYHDRYSPGFLYALDRAFSVMPTERPQSVAEFRQLLDQPFSLPLPSVTRKWFQSPLVWAGAGAGVVALILLFVLFSGPPTPPEPTNNGTNTTQDSSSSNSGTSTQSKPAASATVPFGLSADGKSYRSQSGMIFNFIYANDAGHRIFFCIHQARRRDYKYYIGPVPADFTIPNFNNAPEEQFDDYPVAGITRDGAKTFCDRVTEKEGTANAVFRLPTSDEWDHAAHNGSSLYPWGSDAFPPAHAANGAPVANLADESLAAVPSLKALYEHISGYTDGYPGAAPVMAYGPLTAEGLWEMGTNVEEWTSTKEMSSDHNLYYVARGSSWETTEPEKAQTKYHDLRNPSSDSDAWIGFRVVLELPPQ